MSQQPHFQTGVHCTPGVGKKLPQRKKHRADFGTLVQTDQLGSRETYGGGTKQRPTMYKRGSKFVQRGECTTEATACLENERFNILVLFVRKQPDVVQYSVICALSGCTNTVFHCHQSSLQTTPTLRITFCVYHVCEEGHRSLITREVLHGMYHCSLTLCAVLF